MRPVDSKFPITQGFASLPTRGVVGNLQGTQVQVLVALYGHYQEDGHAGTDIGCPVGTPVRASRSGTVLWCDWDVNLPGGPNDWAARWFFYQRFGGRLLLVQHAPGDIDVYAHLSAWKVQKGQFVNEGDLIALSGDSSGGQDGVLGPHLHTERIVDLAYPTGAGKIYGRIDPTTAWGGLAAQGTITQEDELSAADVEALQKIDNSNADRVILDMRAQIRALGDELAKKIESSEYDVKVWTQEQDNKTGDRVINVLRSDISALSPDTIAELIPDAVAGKVVDLLVERLKK